MLGIRRVYLGRCVRVFVYMKKASCVSFLVPLRTSSQPYLITKYWSQQQNCVQKEKWKKILFVRERNFCYWKIKSKLEVEHLKRRCFAACWFTSCYLLVSLFNTFRWFRSFFWPHQVPWVWWSFCFYKI